MRHSVATGQKPDPDGAPEQAERWLARTGRVLRNPGFRRYYIAQTFSLSGTWMQFTGQIWLVMDVLAPGDARMLGVTAALQSAPIVLTLWGGSLADGWDKRRLLIVTQSLSGALALALGLGVLTHHVSLPFVWLCAVGLGLVNAADAPARQAIIPELVGVADVPNAVALNSASYQATRALGVALAPLAVGLWGLSAPFLLNCVSFAGVIWALTHLGPARSGTTGPLKGKGRPPIREGLAAIRASAGLLGPVAALFLVALFALNFNVTLPVLATTDLKGGLGEVSALLTASSVGAVGASLVLAGLTGPKDRLAVAAMTALAAAMVALALCRQSWLACVIMVPLGASIAATTATVNTLLQQRSDPGMRGRITAVYSLIMQGSALVGGPLVGLLCQPDLGGAPGGLLLGAGAALLGALVLGRLSARVAPLRNGA